MKKLYQVAGVLLACALVAVAPAISARVASPSRVRREGYGILPNLSKGVLAISDKTVTANANANGHGPAS